MCNRTVLSFLMSFALVLGACGSGEAETSAPTTSAPGTAASPTIQPAATTAAPVPVTTAASTTATPTTTTSAPIPDQRYDLLTDEVVYHEDDDGAWEMKVFYPEAEGPWPLVVVYHGIPEGPSVTEARAIAARGAVAMAPRWVKVYPPTMTREEYIDGALFDRAACAVNAGQQLAADYGADHSRTTISGFSAGMHAAGWVGLGLVRNDLCQSPLLSQPRGVVLGDSQFLFYEGGWDESMANPGSPAADTLDRFVNPDRYNVAEDVSVYLWTSDHRHGRDVEISPGTASWIGQRDTTGTLLDDLMAIGAFDDEWIDWTDCGRLMEKRMSTAGIDVVHESVGGGHYYGAAVYDAIEEIMGR
ncbi:MAG: hypothetical protein HKN91_01275 [Acidimicrobiia bacterium]|nr:hypothetical protein [Acidimicrobiia bacterium]